MHVCHHSTAEVEGGGRQAIQADIQSLLAVQAGLIYELQIQ